MKKRTFKRCPTPRPTIPAVITFSSLISESITHAGRRPFVQVPFRIWRTPGVRGVMRSDVLRLDARFPAGVSVMESAGIATVTISLPDRRCSKLVTRA